MLIEDILFYFGGDDVAFFDGYFGVNLEVEVYFEEVADAAGAEVVVAEGAWGGEDVFADILEDFFFWGFIEEVFGGLFDDFEGGEG